MAQLNFNPAHLPCDFRTADISPDYADAGVLPVTAHGSMLLFHALEASTELSFAQSFSGCGLVDGAFIPIGLYSPLNMSGDGSDIYFSRPEGGLVVTYKWNQNAFLMEHIHTQESDELTTSTPGLFGDPTQMLAAEAGGSAIIAFTRSPIGDPDTILQTYHGFNKETGEDFLFDVQTWDVSEGISPRRMILDESGRLIITTVFPAGTNITRYTGPFDTDIGGLLPDVDSPVDVASVGSDVYMTVDRPTLAEPHMYVFRDQAFQFDPEEVEMLFNDVPWSELQDQELTTWVGKPKQIEYISSTNSLYMVTEAQIEGVYYPFVLYRAPLGGGEQVVPALRQRQRDDRFRTPRMGQRVGNHPTSRQYSLRQGHYNTYW